eukprot:10146928-Prorocentrum_lima.AAC.1
MTSSLVGSEMCIRDRLTGDLLSGLKLWENMVSAGSCRGLWPRGATSSSCLLYTSDAADDM